MAEVLSFLTAITLIVLTQTALNVWAAVLFPRRVEGGRVMLERLPLAAFALGFFLTLVLGGISVALLNAPLGFLKMLGWLFAAPLMVVGTVGGGSFAKLIADRISPMSGDMPPFAALVRGGAVQAFAGLFPIVGWFVIAPLAIITAIGAGTLGLVLPHPRPEKVARPQVRVAPAPVGEPMTVSQ